ncbi:MAG: three-Cys-motif partner protein TcmP [Christensenella sp.]|uniref:three-Cys-motif partner protein TcmP n=1 Tax=Christensenella sp. TaxID=1935934 RepID=UPI002B1EEF6F|nr:three-Cys-motif partner protein TcmP [Christensenella sp.]MEA5002116.1 three-Cys-motif partner protein TcmP [Christensenella sp.]
MAKSKNTSLVVSEAKPHTIKKFELIEKYVDEWARKILGFPKSNGLLFIDCMCNSGVYTDAKGETVWGTPIRIAMLLNEIIQNYPGKKAALIFNDLEVAKTQELQKQLDALELSNIEVTVSTGDGNALLKAFDFKHYYQFNTLLVYDPYQAMMDWDAITPFLRTWGEVIINHMVSDTIRGAAAAVKDQTKQKYTDTYMMDIDEILALGNDKNELEKIITKLITERASKSGKQEYLISSCPFFNTNNTLVYNLIHFCKNIEGKKLFKKVSWQTFDGKSSAKRTHELEDQMTLDMYMTSGSDAMFIADDSCYSIKDIAKYLFSKYSARGTVPLEEIYGDLDYHPVFPSDGFKPEIKKSLKDYGYATCTRDSVVFSKRL